MKKTLIALAVLAASGASFAQATISGNVTSGYRASTAVTTAAGVSTSSDSSGLGLDTAELFFTANEDLGGGLKATAVLSFDTVARAGVAGGDTSLTLANASWGALALKSVKGADYLSGGIANVGGVGFDGKIFSGKTYSDSISYTSPSFSGFTIGLSHAENSVNTVTTGQGLGVGAAGAPTGRDSQRSSGISGAYAAGPLAANLGYTTYDQKGTEALDPSNSDSKVYASAAYDFGVFKLGAGVEARKLVKGTRNDALIGAALPLGAFTLNATFASRAFNDNNAATDGTKTGYGLGAAYALSKRTSVVANYRNWTQNVGDNAKSTETNLLLSHSF
ncbi:porin [Rhodoferax saidenbachensis]|uniref:Porin n=1 Tax=Rhodoferax saidenbachensis TaxID=1484693 RepID=A0ABU1ZRM8_9BURK|nr:porin [Rhodoferax saidenbachensis]MDR7308207.1 putative porin [Rhodoferax saidenbachensis]